MLTVDCTFSTVIDCNISYMYNAFLATSLTPTCWLWDVSEAYECHSTDSTVAI